jgi:hypothetical protein
MKIFSKGPFAAIFCGGLLAGVLDLAQAFIGFSLVGSTPFRILQRIAGGIFGMHSRDMGWASAAIGLVCHFTVAFGAATVYYLVSRKLRLLVERPVLCGLFYGELVFLFMYFVVIPLSLLSRNRGRRTRRIRLIESSALSLSLSFSLSITSAAAAATMSVML